MSGRAELRAAPSSRFVLPKRASGLLAPDQRERAMSFVRALIEPPTAPYFEDAQVEVVRAFVHEHPGFDLVEDEHANLVVTWRGHERRKQAGPTLAFSAHLDHPGFHWLGVKRGVARAHFHGGVPARFFPGAPVRFFDVKTRLACATARVKSVERKREELVATLEDMRGAPKRGAFGVFDLTSGDMRGTRLFARVCDDLMGAASILATLDQLARDDHPRRVIGVFTRAEETGFIGCIGLLHAKLLAHDVALIGLECSPRRATAKVGHGPVIRVGDRMSVFDPALTLELQEAALQLREKHADFRFQRALMDGGSCESSAYNLWGVRAGAMCLALGNYHNCGPRETIAPEFVDWNDLEGVIALMVQAARNFGAGDAPTKMRARLLRTYEREYKRLADSAQRLRAAPRRAETRAPAPAHKGDKR